MKRITFSLLLGILLVAVIAVPVLAGYYANLTVTEANGNAYDELGMQVALDVDYLADNGYISSTGLDTRVTLGGTAIPHMLVDDTLLFTTDVEAYGSLNLLFETGETALSSFPIVVGDGGYVTITDHANLELGDDFELEWDGYIDTSISDDLISKTDAFDVSTDGAGHITATIYGYADISQTVSFSYVTLSSTSNTRAGQRVDSVPEAYITQISFYLSKANSPTGTAYIRVRKVSDEAILGTIGTLDVSTLTAEYLWYDFTGSIYNPTSQNLRFTVEYSGGGGTNVIQSGYEDSDVVVGVRTEYDGSWTDTGAHDAMTKIYFGDVSVTASVASGEHTIKVTGDGTDLKIYEGEVEEDSATIIAVLDNANNWVLGSNAIPYMDYYAHTTSDTLRITYEPDSIIVGTTLPNEENPGTYDGTITLGSNPAGVTVSLGGLVSDEQLLPAGAGADFPAPQDIAGDTGQSGLTSGLGTLTDHPFYPVVSAISVTTDIPAGIVWVIGATFILALLFVWMIASQSMMHQMFIGLVGGGWVTFCWHMGIYPFWVIYIYAVLVVAIVIGERSPTIS